MDLYDCHGHRKYLTATERKAFLEAASTFAPEIETFCGVLAHSGCRISEALALTTDRVDLSDGLLIFECLKKRRKGVYRAVPVPPAFLAQLDRVHQITAVRLDLDVARAVPLWTWRRTTAWRRICEVMETAGISGLHASPNGLRHGFAIRAVSTGVPLNMARRWLGHASIATTAIYTEAMGDEERLLAARLWEETCA